MRRSYRILLTALTAALSVGLVAALVLLGTAAEGPIASVLRAVGQGVRNVEGSITQRVRGPGRMARMEFIAPLRDDPDSLRAPGRLLLGAYDAGIPTSLEGVLALEEALGAPMAILHVYTAWGDRPEQRFPQRILEAIRELGSIPLVTWEPWLTDFENRLHPHIPLRDDRDRGGLAAIAEGTYDFYVDGWAREAARFGSPILVRLGHEMNDPYRYPWGPQNNRPEDFVAAWRRVVERFRAAGAHNVLWVWSPHVAYEGYDWFYPGDDVVDWAATGVLNYGTVAHWSRWWTFQEIFGQRYDALAAFGKPVMIAEFGTLAVGGDRSAWLADALDALPERMPALKALLFFHVPADRTITYQAVDWSLLEDSVSLDAVRRALAGWADDGRR